MTNATMEPPADTNATKAAETDHLWGGIDIPIIGLTGPKASGKTLFASTIRPQETLMVDCELSSASYSSLPYKRRVNLFEEIEKQKKDPTPLNAWLIVKEIVEKEQGIRVVVIDPWDFVQAGYVDNVEKNPERFGRTKVQYEKASGLLWADVKSSLHMWLGMQAQRIRGSVVLINHLGKVWKDGKPTEKDKAKGVETIFQLASLYIRLERAPDAKGKIPAAPVGLTAEVNGGKSRVVHTSFDPKTGELALKPVLPPRIENCTPAEIRRLIANPPDWDKLKPSQLAEITTLSEDDKLLLQKEISENNLATETAKLSGLELLKQQQEKQTDLRMRQAAAAAATQAPAGASTSADSTPANGQAATANGQAGASESMASTEPKPPVWDVIEQQRKMLGIKDDQWLTILAKRNCKETRQLTEAQAEEIRLNLWTRLTKSDMGKASVSSKNSGAPATAS